MKFYDRFLPYLIKNTNSGLIDVGSNIGDTLTLVKSKKDCEVICVEPDEAFLKVLKDNIKQNNFKDVLIYPYPISSEKKKVIVQKNHSSSTGSIMDSENGLVTKSINDLFDELKIDVNKYKTIKVDTDGYDWDVLNSINNYCENSSDNFDFIFYEHQTYLNNLGPNDENRLWRENKYRDSLLKLRDCGFVNYFIFDNFGTFILRTNDLNILIEMIQYIRKSETNRHTIYFCDVLICKNDKLHLANKSLEEYVDNDITVE